MTKDNKLAEMDLSELFELNKQLKQAIAKKKGRKRKKKSTKQRGKNKQQSQIITSENQQSATPKYKDPFITVGRMDTSGNRPNLFLEDESLYNAHKEDVEDDKKLSGNNRLTDRGQRQSVIPVQCTVCGKTNNVSPKILDRNIAYQCDKCIRK